MKAIFARHGVASEVFTDNGPQFANEKFRHFAKEWATGVRFPPAQLLMGRLLRSNLSIPEHHLKTKEGEKVRVFKEQQKEKLWLWQSNTKPSEDQRQHKHMGSKRDYSKPSSTKVTHHSDRRWSCTVTQSHRSPQQPDGTTRLHTWESIIWDNSSDSTTDC